MKIENEVFKVRDDQGNVLVTVKATTILDKGVVLGTLNGCPIPAWELTPHIAAEFNHGDWEKHNPPTRMIVKDEADARAEAQRLAVTVLAFNENMKTLIQNYRNFRRDWTPSPSTNAVVGGGGGGGFVHAGKITMGVGVRPLTDAQEQCIREMLDARDEALVQSLKRRKG